MEYKLLGFSQDGSFRRFSFQRVADDRSRVPMAVLADVTIAQKLHVALQDLPVLCSRLLHIAGEDMTTATLTITERDMCDYAAEVAAAAAEIAARDAMRSRRSALANAARTGKPVRPEAAPDSSTVVLP